MQRIALLGGLGLFIAGCPLDPGGGSEPLELSFDFSVGDEGWQAGLADYHVDDVPNLNFEEGVIDLPAEVGEGTGYFVQSNNTPDDLFTFIRVKLDAEDGIEAGRSYDLEYRIVFASQAPDGCAGIGGSPGESVFLKAGAAAAEPVGVFDEETGEYRLNVDKGQQASGGEDLSVTGTIANGEEEGCDDIEGAPFVSLSREHSHPAPVTASEEGELWLVIGTDSGFEGTTRLYYQRVEARLTPREE